jgi:hypothetical protein
MFRSVLTPYLYKHDDATLEYDFTGNLVLQTLDSVPGLRTLRLRTSESELVERMLPHLTHLQVFSYRKYCTDEVIEKLGLHCHNLKEFYSRHSPHVTNASVQHLLRLKKLEILDFAGTQIDNDHYWLLLSELPIRSIEIIPYYTNILDHVADVILHKISHVTGHVEDISLAAERCPNITHIDLDLGTHSQDLSFPAALTTLRILRLYGGDYATCNLNVVLTGIGPRLTEMALYWMQNVNLHDIVTLCHSLESLSLLYCTLLPLDPNKSPDPQSPHFKKLTTLHIENDNYSLASNYNYIRHYVSLKTIRLCCINVFTVKFIRKCVRSGTLANLEEICIKEFQNGALTMKALELLIKHCRHLKTIEGLRHCPLLSPDDIQELKRHISAQKFDLQIK